MRWLAIVALYAACGRGHGADQGPPHAAPAVATAGTTTADAFAGPPLGTSTLVAVPDAVASKVALHELVHGLARPVLLTHAPDDPRRRLFVIEQRGRIRVIEAGKLADRPFFTIDPKLLSDGNEEGLLGLAFHPKYATNGKLYVDYTTRDLATHIVEYRVDPHDPDVVDPSTARELVRIEHPYSNHNGGNLVFGPDGKLYAGMGDGGSAGDPHHNGQNPHVLLAKIMRFDVDGPTSATEIVHIGVRNPWRFWFDAKTGDLYIADVGQNLWESVYVLAGADHTQHNFGWNIVEGNHCFEADDCDRTGFTPPVIDYGHDQGCSVTGGVTYRGHALPDLDGRYFYADYCTGLLRSFRWTRDPSSPTAPGYARDHWDWKAAIDHDGVLSQISSFGTDADGEIYIVELTGAIYELVAK
jgi:glucose/arabinose dehydrogenase